MLYSFVIAFLLWSSAPSGTLMQHTKWIIHQNSTLSVSGTSNIKDFTCRLESLHYDDTLAFTLSPASQIIVFRQHRLHIPVEPFDCGNRLIRKDFLQTLKHEAHPVIQLQFIDLRISGRATWWKDPIEGAISITLGGVSQRYILDYDLNIYGEHVIELNGSRTLTLSDFNLEAPERLAGLVKIDEEVDVSFRLVLHATHTSPVAANKP